MVLRSVHSEDFNPLGSLILLGLFVNRLHGYLLLGNSVFNDRIVLSERSGVRRLSGETVGDITGTGGHGSISFKSTEH